MIVDNLDVIRTPTRPNEADTPLIVDPDAELAGAVATQRLETVSGRYPEVAERPRSVEVIELAPGDTLERAESPHITVAKQPLGILVAKALNHAAIIMPSDYCDNLF